MAATTITTAVPDSRNPDGKPEIGPRSWSVPPPLPVLGPGAKVEQYQIVKLLGRGGMGCVYEAWDERLRRKVALKVLLPQLTCDEESLARFLREGRAVAAVAHENIVAVYDAGQDGVTAFLAMQYLQGVCLHRYMTAKGIPPLPAAVRIAREVAAGLASAHAVGLLHRDIKPGNIIACERGGEHDVAKLLDYGLVQTPGLGDEAKRLTLQGMILGSPPFMPPEQATGRSDVDARADIYSLGGVGYYLLTGRPPFERETAMEMLLAHAYEVVEPPSTFRADVPRDLEAVILRCLEKKPEGRFADVAALERALGACDAAGQWTEADAAAWWRSAGTRPDTADDVPAMAATRAYGPA